MGRIRGCSIVVMCVRGPQDRDDLRGGAVRAVDGIYATAVLTPRRRYSMFQCRDFGVPALSDGSEVHVAPQAEQSHVSHARSKRRIPRLPIQREGSEEEGPR
jgi:hypothetical protein